MNSKEVTSYDKIKSWLDNPEMKKKLRRTLPEKIEVDPWIETALVSIRTDDKILRCTPMSILGALMTIASLGFRLEGALGQAYLESYAVRKWNPQTNSNDLTHYEAQAQVGYRGLIDLVYRDPDVQDVEVFIVHQKDKLDFQSGTKSFVNHTWDHTKPKRERGKRAALVTGLRYKNGYYSFEIYPFEDLIEHRNKTLQQKGIWVIVDEYEEEHFYSTTKQGKEYEINKLTTRNPWIKYDVPMFKKTGIRWSAKYWNLLPDVQKAAQLSALDDAGVSQGLEAVAKSTIPTNMVIEAENNVPNQDKTAPAQAKSIAQNNELAEQMAKEALGHTTKNKENTNKK